MTLSDSWKHSYQVDGETVIHVGRHVLSDVGPWIAANRRWREVFVIVDERVAGWYLEPLLSGLKFGGFQVRSELVQPGESSKSLATADGIYDRLGSSNFPRDGVIIGLGGGMVTDLAGFVAATWHRGVAHVLCPTTLEADIDAAIGGKTAVNHPSGKNLIGAFHQPRLVAVDVHCLETLPDRDLSAGLAESIKHALITDAEFLNWQDQHASNILEKSPGVMEELISRNITIKSSIVSRDAREQTGLRASLNFGHTIGHAIESSCDYRLRHGECVALGMVAAARISAARELLTDQDVVRIMHTLERFGLPTTGAELPATSELMNRLLSDKKVAGGAVKFVLLEGIGLCGMYDDIPPSMIESAIDSLRAS
jgi:3-dehydroquinate synthase